MADCKRLRSNRGGCCWTTTDARPAVFKTVCGALLRRPGWVRFPSIPAKFSGYDSQDDSHSSALTYMSATFCGRFAYGTPGPFVRLA